LWAAAWKTACKRKGSQMSAPRFDELAVNVEEVVLGLFDQDEARGAEAADLPAQLSSRCCRRRR
jgi:hypothetical protein